MKWLNLGCGGARFPEPWINVDTLRSQLAIGTPERMNLDAEPNYVDHDIRTRLPFNDNYAGGILLSHVVEHLDCHDAVRLLAECRRVLSVGGIVVVSVPDAEYFLSVLDRDTRENSVELFGEPICPDEPQWTRFFDYGLFHREHKQILTAASLQCLMIKAGFEQRHIGGVSEFEVDSGMIGALNRRVFSVEMIARK